MTPIDEINTYEDWVKLTQDQKLTVIFFELRKVNGQCRKIPWLERMGWTVIGVVPWLTWVTIYLISHVSNVPGK